MRSATNAVAHIVRDGISKNMSIDRATKVRTGYCAAQLSETTSDKTESETGIKKAGTGVCATLQSLRGAGSIREDEE